MLNAVWVFLIVGALFFAGLNGSVEQVATASTESAKKAVELVIGLIGVMAFWLGLMHVLVRAGAVQTLTRWGRPVLCRLFPEVPPEHPAMGMMLMNMSANLLGLGNAATPFGLKAMIELDKLNEHRGEATNAMALFLAINTSNIAILPTGIIALRTSLGSESPGAIIATTLLATTLSTAVAIVAAKSLQRWFPIRGTGIEAPKSGPRVTDLPDTLGAAERPEHPPARWIRVAAVCLGVASAVGVVVAASEVAARDGFPAAMNELVTKWSLAILVCVFVTFGVYRGVKVFEGVVEGAQEAFQIALKLVPYFIALMVAIGMFRASGAIDVMVEVLSPVTSLVGLPAEALPMALIRPLSGKGAFGVAAETMQAYGADSTIGLVVSTMQGSTETTFYVLALYFGVVAVRNTRHTLVACLLADLMGVLASAWACHLLL